MIIGSLCTGYGGLDLAVEDLFGARTAWASDLDAGASKIIEHRLGVPNLGDLTKVDWSTVDPIDILTAGWPCQPFSQAGKQKGADDARAIWPAVARAVRDLRPRHVVLENVSAIATVRTGPELQRATASLAALGYVGSWRCLRASDVGAPHRRERIFIVASDTRSKARQLGAGLRQGSPDRIRRGRSGDCDGEARLLPTPRARDGKGRDPNPRGVDLNEAVALLPTPSASRANEGEDPAHWESRRSAAQERLGNGNGYGMPLGIAVQLLPTPRATDGTKGGPNQRGSSGDLMLPSAVQLMPTPSAADGLGGHERRGGSRCDELLLGGLVKSERFGHFTAAIDRWTNVLGRPAPDPTIPSRKGGRRLNPRFVEWMMGCPDGWVCDVPGLTIAQQLKALGNGVVRQQAVAAITHMISAEAAA